MTLLSEEFVIDPTDGLLYRITIPRNKKLANVMVEKRLCLPKTFRLHCLQAYHDKFLNHFGREKTYLTLRQRYYYKRLYTDCVEYVASCQKCLQQTIVPLNPLQTPTRPFTHWSSDFLPLVRTTAEGYTAILIFICNFSKLPVIRLVKTQTALETAQVFVESVVANYGLPSNVTLMTDKGSAYTSHFFKFVTKALNIRLVSSAVATARSNGLSESCVQRVKSMIRFHDINDLQLKAALPLVELALKVTVSVAHNLTPYEVVFGFPAELPALKGLTSPVPDGSTPAEWFKVISEGLAGLRTIVAENLQQTKLRNTTQYNQRHHTTAPTWKVGDHVLLLDRRIKNPKCVLTNSRYEAGFVITEIVKNDNFGAAYKLTRLADGKSLKNLISHDRLRLDTSLRRPDFLSINPPLVGDSTTSGTAGEVGEDNTVSSSPTTVVDGSVTPQPEPMIPALKVIKERKKGSRFEYFVQFLTGEKAWCDKLSPALLTAWTVIKRQRRRRRNR